MKSKISIGYIFLTFNLIAFLAIVIYLIVLDYNDNWELARSLQAKDLLVVLGIIAIYYLGLNTVYCVEVTSEKIILKSILRTYLFDIRDTEFIEDTDFTLLPVRRFYRLKLRNNKCSSSFSEFCIRNYEDLKGHIYSSRALD